MVEIIIYSFREFEVRDAAVNRDCKIVSELLSFVSSFTKAPRVGMREASKRHTSEDFSAPLPKRSILMI